jgi:hypothetical protein
MGFHFVSEVYSVNLESCSKSSSAANESECGDPEISSKAAFLDSHALIYDAPRQ